MVQNNTEKITANTEISKIVTKASNLDECEIYISESKLENILLKHKNVLKEGEWECPLGLSVSTLIVLLTADFNLDFFGIGRELWHAMFVVGFVFAVIWLMRSLYHKYQNRNLTIDSLVKMIKNEDRK